MMHSMTFLAVLLLSLSSVSPGLRQARTATPPTSVAESDVEWFRATEQSLMDAIAIGDTAVWERVMDRDCVVTSEEGELLPKEEFLKQLRGLPPGLSGSIRVQDLTVQDFKNFAVVRARLDEQENVFGQQLFTQYRVTDTFRREGDTWKMVASHFSVVTTDPPPQDVSKATWPFLVGDYKLLPNGWDFHVVLRDGALYGGRDAARLRPFIPLAPNVFTLKGSLGEWIFVAEGGKPTKIVHFRKFEPLIWTRAPSSE